MFRLLRIFAGLLFLSLGIVGLVLPILQGWLFLSLGVLTLSVDIPPIARLICRVESRFPWIQNSLKRVRRIFTRGKNTLPPCPPEKR